MSKKNSRDRIEKRRQEAIERQKLREQLTPQQQLSRLDLLLGKNAGAKKERAKLQKQIEQIEQEKLQKKTKQKE